MSRQQRQPPRSTRQRVTRKKRTHDCDVAVIGAGPAGLAAARLAAIAGKRGIFDYAKRLGGYGRETDRQISEEARRLTPAVTHALVRAHPETGDRSLYLDSTTTIGIDYMDTTSGLALLDDLKVLGERLRRMLVALMR